MLKEKMQNVKGKWKKFLEKVKSRKQKIKEYLQMTFGEGRKGMYFTTTLCSAWLASGLVKAYFPMIPIMVCFFVAIVLVLLIAQILHLLIKLLFGGKQKSQSYWFVNFVLFIVSAMIASQGSNFGTNFFMAVLLSIGVDLFGRSVWSLFFNRKISVLGILTFVFTVGEFAVYFFFVHQEGFGTSPMQAYLEMAETVTLEGKEKIDLSAFEASVAEGTCKVETFLYGMNEEADVKSKRYDLTSFAERDGVGKVGMDAYFDYEMSEVPLAGKVYYPVEKNDCPVMFLVHGNHDYSVESYLGYDYLGQYLASHGYVVISVDENSCNDLSDENDGRAVLLLENIKYVLQENKNENSKFYQMIDEDNIAIAGHSRGGETVGTAYLFND